MTVLSLDPRAVGELQRRQMKNVPAGSSSFGTKAKASDRPLPRINLKKRRFTAPPSNLPKVNSAFLQSIFADVENLSTSSEPRQHPKKTRITKRQSCMKLSENFRQVDSPITAATSFFGKQQNSPTSIQGKTTTNQQSIAPATSMDADISSIHLTFPKLPAAVSDSSCSIHYRSPSDQQSSVDDETSTPKDSYGWFVEMDDDDDYHNPVAIASSSAKPPSDLAFSAHIAPKANSHYESEVEWAKAADTVDDVLGDFF